MTREIMESMEQAAMAATASATPAAASAALVPTHDELSAADPLFGGVTPE